MNNKKINCIITGATNGIGKALAYRLAKDDINLFLVARNKNSLKKLQDQLNKKFNLKVKIFCIDISVENSVKRILKYMKEKNFKIDCIVNCAAVIGDAGKIENISSRKWDYTIKVNLYGAFYLFKYLLSIMNKSSLFINFSGGGGTLPQPYLDAYSASKAAVVRLTENVSLNYNKRDICFTTIAPGGINTKIFLELKKLGKNKLGPNLWKEIKQRIISGGDDINNPIELITYVLKLKDRSAFNGRVISAKYDNWNKIYKNSKKLKKNDLFKLRRIDLTNSKITL